MLSNNRIIFSDNGTLSDLSVSMNEYASGSSTIAIVAAEDAIYIGGDLPFNHRYIELSVVNDQISQVSVSLWNGTSFVSAVDVIDQTSTGGKTLAQNGIISWVPDRDETWVRETTTEDIPGLSTVKIYHMYWAKLTFSADLKATTALSYMGHKFSSDNDLKAFYPELGLSTTIAQFQSGKTTWNEQHVAAAEWIIRELRKKGTIWSPNQILDWQIFTEASIHKVAEIIFNAFGDDYEDNRVKSAKYYEGAFERQAYNIDRDRDARLDISERIVSTGFVRR